MGGILFWVIVIGYLIFNSLTKKEDEKKKKSVWKDFLKGLEEAEKPQKQLKPKPKTKPHQETVPFSRTFNPQIAEQLSKINLESVDSSLAIPRTVSAIADLVPIWEAAGHGKYEIVQQKLAAGANVNEPDTFFGETALHRAAKAGDLQMVKILLEAGASVCTVDQYGETPLHFAIRGRNPAVVQILLKYGADPESKDLFGRTPIHCARFYEELRVCFR